MPGIVKIGYSKDVNKRLNSLYSSNVPFPFEVYATLEGVTESADKEIHKFLPSSLRVNNNREFFNITPEYAYDILFQISKVFGVTNRLRKWDESDGDIEPQASQSKALKPRHLQRIGFWKKFNEVSSQMGSSIGTIGEKALKQQWNYFSIGGGKCHIEVSLNNKNHNVSIYYFTTTQNVYTKMKPLTSKIESECGKKLTWNVRPTKKRFSAFLGTTIDGFDFNDTKNYSVWAKQIIETVEAMKQAYQKVVLQ